MCSSSNRLAFSRLVLSIFSCLALTAPVLSPALGHEASNGAGSESGASATKKQTPPETVYELGTGVKPPKLVHYVEPEFSASSEEAFVDGLVRVSTIVTPEGIPTALRILAGLNKSENESAITAVQQWRFEPGTKNGEPVNVRVTVEVAFHLL